MSDNLIRKYPLSHVLLGRALLDGFLLEDSRALRAVPGPQQRRSVFFPALDSATADCPWGRLSFDGMLTGECMLSVRTLAANDDTVLWNGQLVPLDSLLLDPDVPYAEKDRLFSLLGGRARSGAKDLLLTGQSGRFLWLWLELTGDGDALLQNLRVYVPGDNFYHTFPAVYQTEGEFFQRYLSIFSTLYQEFQEELDSLPALLDVDTAPDFMLPILASWLGLETNDSLLSPQQLRQLLRLAPSLIPRKGTRWAVETVVKLFVEGAVFLVERNLLAPETRRSENLYGDSPYDFTILLGQAADEKLRLRLQFLIGQFKPVRANCHIVFLNDRGGLDAFTYLDVNGTVLENATGSLDDGNALTGMTYLQ